MRTSTPQPSRLLLVQMLRAVAALMIVLHHALPEAERFAAASGAFAPSLQTLLPWAAGVDIFFVISGFVMVHASRTLFAQPGAMRIFLSRRLVRIVPLYWFATLAFLAVAVAMPQALNGALPSLPEVAASLFFIPYINGDGLAQPVFSLGWTLNYEMFFYLAFAMALVLPRQQAVTAVAAGLAVLCGVSMMIDLPMPLSFWAAPVVLEFIFGMGLALLRQTGWQPGAVLRILLFAAGVRMLEADLTQEGLPGGLAWGLPAAMIVGALVLGNDPRWVRGMVGRVMSWLGDASYALYLMHPFALRGVRIMLEKTGAAALLGPVGYCVLALLAAVALALAVHAVIERPLHGRLLRMVAKEGNRR